jgi:hypothetical protein
MSIKDERELRFSYLNNLITTYNTVCNDPRRNTSLVNSINTLMREAELWLANKPQLLQEIINTASKAEKASDNEDLRQIMEEMCAKFYPAVFSYLGSQTPEPSKITIYVPKINIPPTPATDIVLGMANGLISRLLALRATGKNVESITEELQRIRFATVALIESVKGTAIYTYINKNGYDKESVLAPCESEDFYSCVIEHVSRLLDVLYMIGSHMSLRF